MSSNAIAIKKKSKEGGAVRISAALFGALIASVLLTMNLAIYLPMPTNDRLALSGILVVPIWIALAFACLLTASAWRSWLYCLLIYGMSFYPLWLGMNKV